MPTFPHQKAKKLPFQQHAMSYNPTFPHQHTEKSPHQQNVVSYNPKLEGASLTADPFEHPINTVQVSRCIPFPGSLL